MKRKKVAVSLVGVILVSCSASTGSSQEGLEDARTHFQAVRVAMEAYEEVRRSLDKLDNRSSREAMSAIEHIDQALKSLEVTAADFRTALTSASLEWEILGLAISQNSVAARAAWAQARPELVVWILRGKWDTRADFVLRSFDQSYEALDISMGYAEYEVDRLLCEGSGNEWDVDRSTCI